MSFKPGDLVQTSRRVIPWKNNPSDDDLEGLWGRQLATELFPNDVLMVIYDPGTYIGSNNRYIFVLGPHGLCWTASWLL